MKLGNGYRLRDDALFNVDMNGQRVATGVTREEAETYLDMRRRAGCGSCYVYLMDKPLTGRRPAWRAPSRPRLPSLRVSDATRQKLADHLRADGTMQSDGFTLADCLQPTAAGAAA